MIVRFSHRLRRYALRCLLAAAATAAPTFAFGAPLNHCAPLRSETACHSEFADTEELCGWVDIETEQQEASATLATHDSCALAHVASLPRPTEQTEPTNNDSPISVPSVAAIAAAACARAGVSVEQIAEPFAMVGPFLNEEQANESVLSIASLESFWNSARDQAKTVLENAEDEVAADIEELAANEPLDVDPYEDLGPSRLVDSFPAIESLAAPAETGIEVSPLDPLTGGSAMIVTLEEDYFPYDLSVRDLKIWNLIPIASHPFCIRSQADISDVDPMWQEFDKVVAEEVESDPQDTIAVHGSADCLLNNLVWEVSGWIEENASQYASINAETVGRGLAGALVAAHNQASDVAIRVAGSFPRSNEPDVVDLEEVFEKDDAASSAGEALLARAGAMEEEPRDYPTDISPVEIATAPNEMMVR